MSETWEREGGLTHGHQIGFHDIYTLEFGPMIGIAPYPSRTQVWISWVNGGSYRPASFIIISAILITKIS